MCANRIEISISSRRAFELLFIFVVLMVASAVVQAQTVTILYSFGSHFQDGSQPYAGLWMDGKGNIFSTTYEGGAFFKGTIFKLDFAGNETVLHSFGSQ